MRAPFRAARLRSAALLSFVAWLASDGANAMRLAQLTHSARDAFLEETQKEPSFAHRIERVSRAFLGARYKRDPLGEGRKGRRDRHPIVDLRNVDCLTFVEQVLAFSQRARFDAAVELLQRYRYTGGVIRWSKRRHLMELQWLPELTRAGALQDVTRAIGGDETREAVRRITRTHYSGAFRYFRRLGAALPLGEARVTYVPARTAYAHRRKLRPGTLLALVRRTPTEWPIFITHVGLIVARGDELVFRHAIHTHKRVIEEPLSRVLRRHVGNPKTLGFHFAELRPWGGS